MKSRVISLSRRSDGAHHRSPTPQISLYLSSTLIQQNNSPKSLSIFHTLPPPPPPPLLILLCYVESWGIRFVSQHALFQRACNQNREGTEREGKYRADNVYNRFIYLLSLASFSVSESNCTLGGMASSDITKKHQTDTQGEMKKSNRVEDWLKDDRQADKQ